MTASAKVLKFDAAEESLRVDWQHYPRITPGIYPAYSRAARIYRDPMFQRWVGLVLFDILSESLFEVLAQLAWFLNLGRGERPKAGRRSKYFQHWCLANSGVPARHDRLAPSVFVKRHARVKVEDTTRDFQGIAGCGTYSIIREVCEWNTGGRK